jgi:hypothetical protein
MNTKSTKMLLGCLLGIGIMLSGCKSAPPPAAAPATTAAGTTNPDGSITNPDGSVTYPAGTAQAREAQGTRNPDGSITNPDGSITYPAGTKPAQNAAATNQAAVAKGPASTAAPAAPREVARRVLTVPSGTRVAVSMSETLSASKNNAGDSFSGVLAQPIQTADGTPLYERGTRVSGTVAAAKGRGRFKGAGDLAIELTSIGGRNVSTTAYEKSQAGKGKRTAGMVGGGAGLGAIIGGLAGGGKGALIGGLAGAGAGTAASAYTGNKDVVIPAESVVTFTLTAPLSR